MSSLYVPPARRDFQMRLDDQNAVSVLLCITQRTNLPIQLVSKDPHCALIHDPMIFGVRQSANSVLNMSREAQTKNGFAPRICVTCGKPFEWRKKWARDWEKVLYCSRRCQKN